MVAHANAEPASAARPRESLFWTLFTWSMVVVLLGTGATLAVTVGGLARLLGDRWGRVAHVLITLAYRGLVYLHPRYRFTMTGIESLPRGPAVFCPNHQSLSDVVYLFALPVAYKWVIKRELFRVPLFGHAMMVARYPAIDRGDADSALALLDQVSRLLAEGIPVLTFPEGTRSANCELGRFHSGPARVAIHNQVPLVPVGVVGTGDVLPRGSNRYPARAHISIHVGEPIATTGRTLRDARALTRELRAAVAAAKGAAARAIDAPSAL